MAVKNGISISSIPFEQRDLPPDPRKRKREPMTAVDRLVCLIIGGFLGFAIWTIAYVILISGAMKASARHHPTITTSPDQGILAQGAVEVPRDLDPFDRLPPFWWGSSVALAFGLFGAVVGGERMVDAFERIVRVEGEVARAVNRA
ncbi:hypothetical protein OJF2_11990 [Aquisphaera giovannonii]|uniref:Uncharacterized protein n=1 Tax=Aquisphaera giovannonii TaxID=406548 RepID=A0A5B9VYM5_9BACT|nr:hypothetical protein [Aquisphaera giovannonii]QEH32720.1 hypothetical protein OJF2_11990 [Aquisphaera giovannonii]